MTTVPPPSTPPPPTTAAPPSAPVVQIVSPPPAVAALPPGTVLEAVVKPTPPSPDAPADAGKQIVTLRTPLGDVTVKLPVQLPDNARVALEIVRTAVAQAAPQTPAQVAQAAPQVTVRVVTIDNQPAVQVLAQLARQAVDTRGAAAQVPLPQIQTAEVQNPLLRAIAIPPGAAWTPSGPAQLIALGTVSGFVISGNPAAMTAETLLNAIVTATGQGAPGNTAGNTPGNTQGNSLGTTPGNATPGNAAPVLANAGTPAAVPSATTSALSSPPFNLAAGGEVGLRIVSITLPGAAPVTATPLGGPPGQIIAGIAPPTSGIAAAPTPTAGIAAPITTLPTATPSLVIAGAQGLGVAPPQPPTAVQMPSVLTTLTGTVIGQGANGAPVIETSAGQVQLNLRANLPVGTHITLEITAQLEARAASLPPTPAAALPFSGPPGAATAAWPTLTESLAVLQRSDPQAAQALSAAIPDGGPRTAAALISFAQAMKSGDARQWPGDTALRALERAGPRGAHLASTLSDEVAALSTRARDTGTEWRALPIPWNAGGQIDRIALVTRREGENDDDAQKKSSGKGTRFLINLDLSRLGSMQLDGMFRKDSKGFDLMIRTKVALPDEMRNDLAGLFANSNAAVGLKGGLTFQVVKKFADPVGGPLSTDKSGLWA